MGEQYQHRWGALLYKMGKIQHSTASHNTKLNHNTQQPTWAAATLPFSGFCPLSPWQHLPCTQILAPLLPMGPYKVRGVGCALAALLYVGTLKDGFICKVPLPQAPQIQQASHASHVTRNTFYLAQTPCIHTSSDLTRSLAGMGRRVLLPFSLALM